MAESSRCGCLSSRCGCLCIVPIANYSNVTTFQAETKTWRVWPDRIFPTVWFTRLPSGVALNGLQLQILSSPLQLLSPAGWWIALHVHVKLHLPLSRRGLLLSTQCSRSVATPPQSACTRSTRLYSFVRANDAVRHHAGRQAVCCRNRDARHLRNDVQRRRCTD